MNSCNLYSHMATKDNRILVGSSNFYFHATSIHLWCHGPHNKIGCIIFGAVLVHIIYYINNLLQPCNWWVYSKLVVSTAHSWCFNTDGSSPYWCLVPVIKANKLERLLKGKVRTFHFLLSTKTILKQTLDIATWLLGSCYYR